MTLIPARTIVKLMNWNKHAKKRNRALMGIRCTEEQAELITWFVNLDAIFKVVPAPDKPLPPEQYNPKPEYPRVLMQSYFGQWLIGLCDELIFPDQFHACHINLFSETAKIDLPVLNVSNEEVNNRLLEFFLKTYAINHPIRCMLFSMWSIHEVRELEEIQ